MKNQVWYPLWRPGHQFLWQTLRNNFEEDDFEEDDFEEDNNFKSQCGKFKIKISVTNLTKFRYTILRNFASHNFVTQSDEIFVTQFDEISGTQNLNKEEDE